MDLVEKERKAMPFTKSLLIAVVMLLLCWSQRATAIEQQSLQERNGRPSSHSAVTPDQANTSQEPSPLLVAQWSQGIQANACACPAIICSALRRSEACQVSCPRGRVAYCQCGSCNGIDLSSP